MSYGTRPFGSLPFGAPPPDHRVEADSGSFAITGQAAGLLYGRELFAGSGSFSITGTASSLEYGRELTAESGAFFVTGQMATFWLAASPSGFTREPIIVIEIDQDFCQNTYGVSPCTAGRVDIGTAQGGSASTIDFDTSASAENDAYTGMVVRIVSGTGTGQERDITDYVGATGVATVSPNWTTPPDGTSVYHVINRPLACFNTFKTCQDTANFVKGKKTIYFCKPDQRLPLELSRDESVVVIPSVVDVQQTPSRINTGGSAKSSGALGTRGTATVTFRDHPSSDLQLDPYVKYRSYDPETRGTWWTKFLARNPYFETRELRIRQGRHGQHLAEMSVLYYVLDRVHGPDANARVQVGAFDRLRLADDERAQCPRLSKGALNANITNAQTTITVDGTTIAEDYDSSSGTIRIGDEVITYTGISESLGVITFTGCSRGQDNTLAAEHDDNDQVQRCVRFTNQAPVDVIYTLLNTWAEIDDKYLDEHGWKDESDVWLAGFLVTTLITEPTGITTLLGELCEQVQLFIWWDEKEQLVKLAALRAPTVVPDEVNESEHILRGSMSFKLDPTQRITELWVYFLRINPTKPLNDTNNYAQTRVKIDSAAEGANEYDGIKVRRIFSRWLVSSAQVNDIQTRMLARYRDTPVLGVIALDGKDRERWWTGDLINVRSRLLTDFTGAAVARQFQVVSAQEEIGGERLKLELQNYELLALRQARYMAAGAPTYAAASSTEKATGAWYADEFGLISGDEGYEYQ